MLKQISVILTALVVFATAKNATLHIVEDPIKDHYIVVMKPGVDTVPIQKHILTDLSGVFSGATIKHTYTRAINGFSAKLTMEAVQKLLALDEVKYITQDGTAHTSVVPSWGLDRISQRRLPLAGQYEFTGNGTGVNAYVIDTGIYPDSLFFGDRATAAYDAIPEEGAYGMDCNGHGTHCAGTLGGYVFGVAPGVKLFGVRVLNCEGLGRLSDIIAGVEYVANSGEKPAVASMSLEVYMNQALDDAVRGMVSTGIAVAVAAGNSKQDACNFSPARVREAITVGATDSNDERAWLSNFGQCLDIFAPGVFIPSASIKGTEVTSTKSGTSMACPHVAGAMAIALGNAASDMSPSALKEKLMDDATEGLVQDPGSDSPNRLLYVP